MKAGKAGDTYAGKSKPSGIGCHNSVAGSDGAVCASSSNAIDANEPTPELALQTILTGDWGGVRIRLENLGIGPRAEWN